MQPPEIDCLEPANYNKYFQALCWSGSRQIEKKKNNRRGDKYKWTKTVTSLSTSNAPILLGNPSHFGIYATVRKTVLSRWRILDQMSSSDESDSDDPSPTPPANLSKITGVGIKAVFTLISRARFCDAEFCEQALLALLDVLQGHLPEELNQEQANMISNLHNMLVEIASGSGPSGRAETPSRLTALSTSCLMALAVARGEAELILNTIASLIMAQPALTDQLITVPHNLTKLQRCVQRVILGTSSRNFWLHYGVPTESLVFSFPVDLPLLLTSVHAAITVRSLVSDGCFLYVFTSKGLLKIGSGYGGSIRQHVYQYKPDFFASERHGWMGFCMDKLYVRIGRKKTELYEVDKDTLEVIKTIKLEVGEPEPIEAKSAVFSDGKNLGLIVLTNNDDLTIRLYDMEEAAEQESVNEDGTQILRHDGELRIHLLQRRTLILGRAPYDDGTSRRLMDLDTPTALQLIDSDDDPLLSICAGQDFGLLTTASGKIYYTGKTTSLGYKLANPSPGRWHLMKETALNKNEASSMRKCKVVQIAVGHEGTHAVIILDNGTALFTGTSRRGEDGDLIKHRRPPKPTRPKKIMKAEGYFIVHAACNYSSTALVTKEGLVLMFGKDTQHCDPNNIVTSLKHEVVTKVALGKAHAVALTSSGQVYTFGINNRGQCGREFGYTKEKANSLRRQSENNKEVRACAPGQHSWQTDNCRVCVLCRECTGFANACQFADSPKRVPKEFCGCGEGDGGCSTCGFCRRCAEVVSTKPEADEELDRNGAASGSDARSWEERPWDPNSEPAAWRANCLPPARVPLPGAPRIAAIACGLHHTVLLTTHGEVLTFGSNQYGQLGAGDVHTHHRIVRVRVPRSAHIAAGSNHTAIITRDGELYTFGSYQKGSLGRPRVEGGSRDRGVWFATPTRVPRIGPRYASRAVWLAASGEQTFLQLSHALINTDAIFSATITANNNAVLILPNRPEHTFKCITIHRLLGSCYNWTGPEQVDFVNSLSTLDPLYDVLWCYQPQMRVIKCYDIFAFDPSKLNKCGLDPDTLTFNSDSVFDYPNCGNLKRLEEFRMSEFVDEVVYAEERKVDSAALTNLTILNQELAIPIARDQKVTRMHAALHMLGCLDSLIYAHDKKLSFVECKRESTSSPVPPSKEDFQMVNRFEGHGGGWGYSNHSVEAIRFMCDTDILLGGFCLFGGRGDYTAKIRLYDIGFDGGEHECDGELISDSDEVLFECAPRDKFPVLFDTPVSVHAGRWYVAWAAMSGPSSDCGSSGQAVVITDDIGFHFKTSNRSNNGTDVNAGQIPCLLYNIVIPEPKQYDICDPVHVLTKNISRKVTVECLGTLISLLQWSWTSFRNSVLETNGQLPLDYQKLKLIKHQKRLVYVIRASLRLIKAYINEVYPKDFKKRNSNAYMAYLEAIGDVRNLIQTIMAEPTPNCSMLPKKQGKTKAQRVCYVQFALEMNDSILSECHETVTACFHAFFPTPSLKWYHLCYLLYQVKDGVVGPQLIREMTSTCIALCVSRSLRDVLQYVVPMTQSCLLLEDTKRPEPPEPPAKCATMPRASGSKPPPPPVPPRANLPEPPKRPDPPERRSEYKEWHLLDVLPRLMEVVTWPLLNRVAFEQCAQPHDHGEMMAARKLSDAVCKLYARTISELALGAPETQEIDISSSVKHLVTPTRFTLVNPTRAWNTGNGSPDAICFTVDRSGVCLVGAFIYVGMGHYEYELELLHDVKLKAAVEEGHMAHCWVSVEVAHGTWSSSDCPEDSVEIKFDRPVPLREDSRYAIRLCNHGGRTVNGDCGLPSVKGPDGTTFRFASCSLSFNGTSLARGQIPSLIYYSTSRQSTSNDTSGSLASTLRTLTIRASWFAVTRAAEVFRKARIALRGGAWLSQSSLVTTLLPLTLATLCDLNDTKSVVQLLEMVRNLLPDVAAVNQLSPYEEPGPPQYVAWAESAHPYSPAIITHTRVLFPPHVTWILLEMDPRSITAQPEDSLVIYAKSSVPRPRCPCADASDKPPTIKKRYVQLCSDSSESEEACDDEESQCLHYNCNFIAVTQRLANKPHDWPQKALLVPGNEVIFSLETSSDYLVDHNQAHTEESRFGYRCLCTGYEDGPLPALRSGLSLLENDLVFAGAACAARLLTPDLELPSMSHLTVLEVQNTYAPAGEDDSEARLMSRGLELPAPPTVHQVLDGQPLPSGMSPERQFLVDLVSGTESTAGGRLARWLCPAPCVELARCELRPPTGPVRPAMRTSLLVLLRDQYGDIVTSPALNIEVVVQRVEEPPRRVPLVAMEPPRGPPLPRLPFRPIVRENMRFQAITMMKPFSGYSFEELRMWQRATCGGGAAGGNGDGRAPAERLAVRSADGALLASWTPRAPGVYTLRCTLDEHPLAQELTVEVVSGPLETDMANSESGTSPQPPRPARVKRFVAQFSSGLRVRASPSLQAEELGRVPDGATISFVEEVSNKDGTWVRLGSESCRAYADHADVAWCLQYNRHLERCLLRPVTPTTEDGGNLWGDESSDVEDMSAPPPEPMNECDTDPGSDSARPKEEPPRPCVQRILQRKTNGNGGGDEWWCTEICDVGKGKDEPPFDYSQMDSCSRLAQTGTQTSPDDLEDPGSYFPGPSRERGSGGVERSARPRSVARTPPPPPPPRKPALSPAQAECLRAVFAALLWHEGIVHDAIACAAFLKFHPQLPKSGASVVTRGGGGADAKPQRHSVAVPDQYVRMDGAKFELIRSRVESSSGEFTPQPISENGPEHKATPGVVSVLPPALRALVAIWDALYDLDQLAVATENFRPQDSLSERNDIELETQPTDGSGTYRRVLVSSSECELCSSVGGAPQLPHLRQRHPGCCAATHHGYCSAGVYAAQPASAACGQSVHGSGNLWYAFCERCRESSLRSARPRPLRPAPPVPGSAAAVEAAAAAAAAAASTPPPAELDHRTIRDNALFLLELASLTDEASSRPSDLVCSSTRSPPAAASSEWLPPPPLHCMGPLGGPPPEPPEFHSLRRPHNYDDATGELVSSVSRVPRSVSLGQAGADTLSAAAAAVGLPMLTSDLNDDDLSLTGAGSSLLSQPSPGLLNLAGGGVSALRTPRPDAEALLRRAPIVFALARRDLSRARHRLQALVRLNTVRKHALEALNWLLRSTTQPSCAHDVMWWFCSVLDKHAKLAGAHAAAAAYEDALIHPLVGTASASGLCPGGRAGAGSRAAFHAFLGSVSTLAAALPVPSPAALQALRCWALRHGNNDNNLLHRLLGTGLAVADDVRSQVFSVISKILSRGEDCDDIAADSFHSNSKDCFIWKCIDVTGWCDVSVSSRLAMANALTDGSTETFWESGDEDRNKGKWVQIAAHLPPDEYPSLVCLHIDNTRDMQNKTLLVSFLLGYGSGDLVHMQDLEVDTKCAGWLIYTLPRLGGGSIRVRCELRGPESAVRVRQLRVLSMPQSAPAEPVPALLRVLAEDDALRVFRLLTSQVFGKLLECDDELPRHDAAGDSDLTQHVVGILFAGDQLTSLQSQVMSHIVGAIGGEAARLRDDFETILLCRDMGVPEPELERAENGEYDDSTNAGKDSARRLDSYCFEMLSLLLALSGSEIGRTHLSQRTELLNELLALLHAGSERVQRQVIFLLRRMIAEISPLKMQAAINQHVEENDRAPLLEHLIVVVAGAIRVQVRVKGTGWVPKTATLAHASPNQERWFARRYASVAHARLVVTLLTDMAQDKISLEWGAETRSCLGEFVLQLTYLPEPARAPEQCMGSLTVWLALGALCVLEPHYLPPSLVSGRSGAEPPRALCGNHDDGRTPAVVECRTCGPLCAECDRCLHLPRVARRHHRQVCKEEESAIRIDIHEGCGRAKLFWLLLLVDRRTLKALAEFRMETGVGGDAGPSGTLTGVCRFCGATGNAGLLAIGNVCADQQCQEYGRECCQRVLSCGHSCGGVRNEPECLPCLHGCVGEVAAPDSGEAAGGAAGGAAAPLRQDADDMCMICFTDPLQAAPAIQLKCGHVFHLHCCKQVLNNKWNGPRITFSFQRCPICKEDINHWTLDSLLEPLRKLRDEVRRKALMRLEYEGSGGGGGEGAGRDMAQVAMDRYAYYLCHKCGKAYYGGLARCEAEWSGRWSAEELACGACSDVTGARICPKHGADFLEYKCRYCCSVAVFFCFGTSHFCNACHDDFQRVTNMPKEELPHCPAGPKCKQLPGTSDECPLHVSHPATGEEFALGCGVCRQVTAF